MLLIKIWWFVLFCKLYIALIQAKELLFPLSLIHFNDFHARFEEINELSGTCNNQNQSCIGGFSRMYETSIDLLATRPNSLLLNAGDNFGGSLWYTLLKWNVTQHFFNKLPTDVMTLGNHEFDDRISNLVSYLQATKTPVVVSNIDISKESSFDNLINKSIVLSRGGRKIGVIGVITSATASLANTGKLIFKDESDSVNEEANRLVEEEDVFTNIVLSHCGYDADIDIARKSSSKISVIVGGHSHTYLYSGNSSIGPDVPIGPYPTIVENSHGKVLIVQASSYSKYLGNLTVFYNEHGNVVDWSGAPIFLENTLPTNEEIDEDLLQWKKVVDAEGNKYLGETLVKLENKKCRYMECEFGNFVADAMANYYLTEKYMFPPTALLAMIHGGGIRAGIEKGSINMYDLASVFPFGSNIDLYEINGGDLWDILEHYVDVKDYYDMQIFQIAGMRIGYNLTKPQKERLSYIQIKDLPSEKYNELDKNKYYQIILPSFLASSEYFKFKGRVTNIQMGALDIDVISNYLRQISPIEPKIQDRIIVINK